MSDSRFPGLSLEKDSGAVEGARLQEAQLACARGWILTPLNGKRPTLKAWQTAPTPDAATIARWATSSNLGVRTGIASGIVVIDIDTDDPSIAERLGLPSTPSVRTSRGRHYYFQHPGNGPIKNSVGKVAPGVDVRADGGCVALPGSIHPETGWQYVWEAGKSPEDLPLAPLPEALLGQLRSSRKEQAGTRRAKRGGSVSTAFAQAKLAAASALVATAAEGTRNDVLNRQAFLLKRFVDSGALAQDDVDHVLTTAAVRAGLPEDEIQRTLQSARNAQPTPVFNGTAAASGGQAQDSSDQSAPAGDSKRPVIVVEPGCLLQNVAAAEAALLIQPECPLYQRGNALFRVVPDNSVLRSSGLSRAPITYTLHIVDHEWLVQEFMECADFVRPDAEGALVPIDCTPKLARSYLARLGDWKVPLLNSIVSTPTLRLDGSIVDKPGYDAASRMLFLPGGVEFPPVPDSPTFEQARAAIAELLAPIAQFPFVEPADRSVALAAMLTAIVRRSLPSAPAIAFRAPTMGSGKSLLTDVITILQTGRVARVFSLGTQIDEEKKTIFAALLSGAPTLALDNVDHAVGSPVLCSILTQEVWQARVLGMSRNVAVPTDVLVIINGNNLQFAGDIVTRVLPCDLDPGCERPEEREFVGDLRATVSELRPHLVVAALTVMRAYIAAGKPKQKLVPFGRFEAWSDLVRSALVWVGEPDPCLTRARLRHDDPVAERLGRFLQAWFAAYQSRPMLVADVATTISPGLRECLVEVAGDTGNAINRRRLGNFLSTYRKRWVDGLRLERDGSKGHAARWRVDRKSKKPALAEEFEEFQESVAPRQNSQDAEARDCHPEFERPGSNSSNSSNSTPPLVSADADDSLDDASSAPGSGGAP